MEQSTDGTRFPLWRALALGGFAAAAFTAVALFGSPSSAHADDGATDPSLLGAVTEVVGSLEQPVNAVAEVVDVVDTAVIEPVVDVVDEAVAAVPVVNDVVEETVGAAPVAAIVDPVVQTVDQTLTGVADVVTVPVPSTPIIDPIVPVLPQGPAADVSATDSTAGGAILPTTILGPPTGEQGDSTIMSGGQDREDTSSTAAEPAAVVGSSSLPATPANLPLLPDADGRWAVTPSGSGSSGSGGAVGGAAAAEQSISVILPAPGDDRRGPARDEDLPASPTFPSDTSPD
ncbi:hypothetical protein PUY80_06975 [Plantibacter flavus]|uniref:hypothetical protein n=1 Tax=Plantibacter flavus TaxID=150123 RepID=UPI0023792C65|nr:hypothetical protein [Plantibacter flavus]MDD9152317.1 hypothetical protein [Plantibacter flavus]